MKNISLYINIVLAVAIALLFFLYFSLKSRVKDVETQPVALKTSSGKIVYINTDTLNLKYDLYIDMRAKMLERQQKIGADLNAKKNNLERKVMDYQDKMQKGLLLRSEAAKIEQQLVYEQQALQRLNDSMQNQLAEEAQVENRRLLNSIVEFLKDYNKNGRYQYILSHAYGSNLLYANDSLDITREVLKGLNQKYSLEKRRK